VPASGEVAQTRPAEEAVRPDRGQPDLEDPEDLRAAVVVVVFHRRARGQRQ
jgi:hypothetical protein